MIPLLSYMGLILVGFVLGNFFQPVFLLILTGIWLLVLVVLYFECTEIAVLIPMIVLFGGLIVEASIWLTFYLTTGSHWMGDFLHGYILR